MLTAVTALLLCLALPAAACAAPAPGAVVGVSPGAVLGTLDDAQLDADMAAIARSGAGWVRLDVDWSVVEPERGRWEWADVDRTVGAAQRHDLRVLGLLTYTPRWARAPGTTNHGAPFDPADFARFAAAAAQRYGDAVGAWEIWNEPNLAQFWEPRPEPERYAELVRAAAAAVRAHDGDPVLSGGLAPAVTDGTDVAPEEFLDRVYAAGAGGAFDAVAAHPYSFPALPSDATTARWNSFQRLGALHGVMSAHGDGDAQVWLTEFGAPTGTADGAVTEQRQAQIVQDGFATARALPFVGPVFVYALRDAGPDPADREQNFGVLRLDGTPKPAWDVLVAEAARPVEVP